jgi:dolichol-phosphate mannosyltransferase
VHRLDPRSRRWLSRPQPYLAAGAALLIFSPVIFWNYQHEWASFLFQSQRRIAGVFIFSTPELLGAILLLLTPTGLLAVWTTRHNPSKPEPGLAPQGPDAYRRHWLFALCMALVPLSVFVFFSFSREVKLSWAGPLWLAFIPLMASSLPSREATGSPRPVIQRAWSITLLLLVLSYGLILHYFSLGIPGIPFNTSAFFFGGEDLAGQIEQTVKRVEEKRGKTPIVIGMDKYRLASGLAFYRAKASNATGPAPSHQPVLETTGRHLFDLESLMYAFWQAPAALAGRDLLVIADEEGALDNRFFIGRAKGLGKIRSFPVKKYGKEVGVYYYRLITRYNPDGPVDNHAKTTPISSVAIRPAYATMATNEERL